MKVKKLINITIILNKSLTNEPRKIIYLSKKVQSFDNDSAKSLEFFKFKESTDS